MIYKNLNDKMGVWAISGGFRVFIVGKCRVGTGNFMKILMIK